MPPLLLVALVVILLGAIWYFFLGRGAELFCVGVRGGRAKLRRGKIPPRLLQDIDDIVRRAKVPEARIRVVLDSNTPRVVAEGLSEGCTQQVRNVVGAWQVTQLRAGRGR